MATIKLAGGLSIGIAGTLSMPRELGAVTGCVGAGLGWRFGIEVCRDKRWHNNDVGRCQTAGRTVRPMCLPSPRRIPFSKQCLVTSLRRMALAGRAWCIAAMAVAAGRYTMLWLLVCDNMALSGTS